MAKFSNQGQVGRPIEKTRFNIELLEEKGSEWSLTTKEVPPNWKKGELICTFKVLDDQLWNVTSVVGPKKFNIKKKA